jgi:hypothetical protein
MCDNPNCKYKYQCNCNDCSCSPNTDGEKGLCKCCKDIMVAGVIEKNNDS